MDLLRILSPLINFSVIGFIGLKTINTNCFNSIDINLSLIALIFSVLIEIKTLSSYKEVNYNGKKS